MTPTTDADDGRSPIDRLRERIRRGDPWMLGLALLSGLLAALIVSPMAWLLWRAGTVDPTGPTS